MNQLLYTLMKVSIQIHQSEAEVQPIHSVGWELYDSIHVRCCVDVTTASLVGGSPKEFTADFLKKFETWTLKDT